MTERDKKIASLREALEKKKASLKDPNEKKFKTKQVIELPEVGKKPFSTINSIHVLVEILAHLICKKESFESAAKLLGVDVGFVYDGYSFEDWKNDIQIKIDRIKYNAELKDITRTQKQLEDLESEDAKADRALDEIMGKLS